MQLIRGIYNLNRRLLEYDLAKGCTLTIGNFDGVHLGHQAILQHLRKKADELNLPTVVMIFDPQPLEYLMPEKAPARLMSLREKLIHLQKAQIDFVICVRFDSFFSKQNANQFIKEFLLKKLNVKFLSVGDDSHFGANRSGNFQTLVAAGEAHGFQVENNHSFQIDANRVSSTAIRHALANDDLFAAEKLLGKPFSISGRVIHGNKLGRTIGFPTANILLRRKILPIQGVFAVKIKRPCQDHLLFGVANVGHRPTINGVLPLLEVNIFDFSSDLYGQFLEVIFCQKIRKEMKFPSIDDLKKQITADVNVAKTYFKQITQE